MLNKPERSLDGIQCHYVIGLGRSGTSLLLRELGKRKNVVSNPESLFVLDFLYVQDPYKEMTPKEISFFLKQIFSLKTGRYVSLDIWKINREKLEKSLKELKGIRFIDLIKLIHLNSIFGLKKDEITTIIDKNPPYTKHVQKLLDLDKKSKFVGIYRSYIDNILSRNKYKLDTINHPYYHALIWCKYNQALLKATKQNPDKVYLIQYEKFVAEPDNYLEEIHLFLDIKNIIEPSSGNMLDEILNELNTDKEKEEFLEMHGKVFQKIDSNSIDKPFDSLKSHELNAIHWICSKTSLELGYKPVSFTKPNLFTYLKIQMFKMILIFVEFKHRKYYQSSHTMRKLLTFVLKPKTIFKKS